VIINIDTLILENTIVNYFLLYITSQTIRVRTKFKNIILPAVLGGVYVITLLFPSLRIFTLLPFKILVAIIMILLLFKRKNLFFNLKALSIYLIYSMILAGICFFIALSKEQDSEFTSVIVNFSYKSLMLAIIIIYLFINRLVVYVKDRTDIKSLIYRVDIVNKNVLKTVTAFLDTGNELREPATNLPVMIVEKGYLEENELKESEKLYIPYKVVNGDGGKLFGFKPDYIIIYNGKEKEIREVIVAFCDDKLNKDSDYNALLSRGII
jgi:stage II sporulation protein GA (sporulation sigma-E factor processing peptidase)